MKLPMFVRALAMAAFAMVITVSAQAETLRAPAAGTPALAVDVPTGWVITKADDNNAFARGPRSTVILQLSMMPGDDVASLTLAAAAAEVLKSAGAKPYSRTQPGTVAGHAGETFFSEMTNDKGVRIFVVGDFARLDSTHIGMILTLTVAVDANPQDQAALAALKANVRLIGAP